MSLTSICLLLSGVKDLARRAWILRSCCRPVFWALTPFSAFLPGPSTSIDTACSSSLLALENAFHAIRQGRCDAALVGGVNLLLKPNTSVQFMKLGMLSPEGTCRSFDSAGILIGSFFVYLSVLCMDGLICIFFCGTSKAYLILWVFAAG